MAESREAPPPNPNLRTVQDAHREIEKWKGWAEWLAKELEFYKGLRHLVEEFRPLLEQVAERVRIVAENRTLRATIAQLQDEARQREEDVKTFKLAVTERLDQVRAQHQKQLEELQQASKKTKVK